MRSLIRLGTAEFDTIVYGGNVKEISEQENIRPHICVSARFYHSNDVRVV